jgi:lipoate-protein ligase B
MAVLMILDGKRLLSQRAPGIKIAEFINVSTYEAIKEYALERFNVELHYRDEDPGLYTAAGAKIASTGFDIYEGFYIYSYNINLSADLSKYQVISVCGVRGRIMGNLITDRRVNDAETFAESEILLPRIWDRLYHRSNHILRWPETALQGTPVQLR